MADFIDREELLELLQTGYECEEAPCWSTCPWIEAEIKRVPSVDAVEVVRCEDCKYYKYGHCFQFSFGGNYEDMIIPVNEDDYCKWGEKE